MEKKGLIQVYTGTGKGKSTAAIGQAVRAAGHGFKVGFLSFFKDPEAFGYGEYKSLENLGIRIFLFAKKELIRNPSWDMLVLDEVNIALRDGFLKEEDILSLLNAKPDKLELVLTGRGVTEKIIEMADLVSEIREVKHPYSRGVKSRKGIEY
jgi:cob(I)alamin adenosyltransferase